MPTINFFSEPLGKYSPNFAQAGFELRVLKDFRMVGHAVFQKGYNNGIEQTCLHIYMTRVSVVLFVRVSV